jgi:hypothetical protein
LQAKLLREIFKLIATTYNLVKAFVIDEPHKNPKLARIFGPDQTYPKFFTPRLANRQLKYHFAQLLEKYLTGLLNNLQQIFRSSSGTERWAAAFCAILGLGITLELLQQLAYRTADAKLAMGDINDYEEAERIADRACRDIDEKMKFITQIFRWKYCRATNPLRDMNANWTAQLRDENVIKFVKDVTWLISEQSKAQLHHTAPRTLGKDLLTCPCCRRDIVPIPATIRTGDQSEHDKVHCPTHWPIPPVVLATLRQSLVVCLASH